MNERKYFKLTPFKMQVLQSFPFIDEDFDALTNYELLCKVVDYLNKTISNVDLLNEKVEEFETYFDNLDVQEEINNKLDEMAEDGTLADIINQEIFGELNDAINTINDTTIPALEDNIDSLKRNAIYIGNSYSEGTGSTGGHTGLFALTKDMFENAYNYTTSGGGFLTYTDHPTTFESLLDSAIADTSYNNDTITDIIVIGAWGESRCLADLGRSAFLSSVATAIQSFVTKAKNNFSNLIHIKYVWAESRNIHTHTNSGITNKWNNCFDVHNIMKDYCPLNGIEYMGWIGFNILMTAGYFATDNIHPSDTGYKKLSQLFKEAYNGNLTYSTYYQYFNTTSTITTDSYIRGYIMLNPDHANLVINRIYIKAGTSPSANTEFNITPADLKYAIPKAYGYNLDIGFLSVATESTYDPANNIIAKLSLGESGNDPVIIGTARNQQTIATNIDYAPTMQSNYIIPFYSR